MLLHRIALLRRLCLPLLARFNPGDITIPHHFTGEPFRLHSFQHKGYWYHGKRREGQTMELFRRWVRPGATVLDVGAHIGYVALYLARLVGPAGRVFAFEPGANNLPYLRQNTQGAANIEIVDQGVGSRCERRTFYLENLTGQNNSFLSSFKVFEENKARAYAAGVRREAVEVQVVTLDEFCRRRTIRPDFVKIDVEGFEAEVLRGAAWLLSEVRPMLMVEIQTAQDEILALARRFGYRVLSPEGNPLGAPHLAPASPLNTFWLHEHVHAATASAFLMNTDGLVT